MASRRTLPWAIRAIAAFALLLAALPVALAQTNDLESLTKPLAGWSADLERIDKTLQRDDLADDTLVHLRSGAEEVREGAAALVDRLRQRLAGTQSQLAKLGPAPKPEDPPEPEAAARERQQLLQAINELGAVIKTAEVLQTRAAQIANRVQERRRTLFSQQILKRVASPFSPSLWRQVRMDLDVALLSLRLVIDEWRNGITAPWLLLVAAALALAVWTGLAQLARRLVERYRSGNGAEPPPFLRRTASAVVVASVRALPPVVGLCVLYAALLAFGLLPGRVQSLAQSGLLAAAAVAALLALIGTVLAPRQPRWRIFPATDRGAQRLAWLASAIAVLYGLDLFLNDLNAVLVSPLSVTIVQKLLGTVSIALLLALLLVTPMGTQEPARESESVLRWGWLRGVLWLVVIAIVTAAALGYVALARFIAGQVVVTGSLLLLVYLLHVSIEELEVAIADPETSTGRWLTRRLGLEARRREQLGVFLSLFLNLLLVLIAVPLVLLQWGFDVQDVRRWIAGILFDVRLGNWNISLATLLVALLLFLAGLVATRILQHWLEAGVLKRARFEQGARSAIATVVGYAGIVFAAIIAFSYTGLDFSNVAIIAGALGVGIGFGLQSIVNNFVSGLILLAERRISVGDWIVVGSEEGHVRRISVRATEIETFDRNYVIIPNSELITHTVKNWTFRHRRARVVIPVGVAYDSDAEQVHDLLLACAKANPEVLDNPAPRVLFDDFGDSALMFRLVAFIGDVDKLIAVRSGLRFAILKALREAKIEIPFPQRDLHLKDIDRIERLLAGGAAATSGKAEANKA